MNPFFGFLVVILLYALLRGVLWIVRSVIQGIQHAGVEIGKHRPETVVYYVGPCVCCGASIETSAQDRICNACRHNPERRHTVKGV